MSEVPRDITFILGAGASISYGFPSGAALIREIIDFRNVQYNAQFKSYIDDSFGPANVNAFLRNLYYSPLLSIDRFLANYLHDPIYQNIGKACISFCINRCENEDKLFEKAIRDDRSGIYHYKKSWYAHVFNKMVEFLPDNDPTQLANVPLNFITFNYDRSFEYFLFRSLQHSYNLDAGHAEAIVSDYFTKRIFHVHGDLGSIFDFPYRPVHEKHYSKLSVNFRIVHEADDVKIMASAGKALSQSKCVYFMGLSFGYDNLRKLRFPFPGSSQPRYNYLFGCRYGIKMIELENIKKYFDSKRIPINFFDDNSSLDWDLDCYDFVRNCVDFT